MTTNDKASTIRKLKPRVVRRDAAAAVAAPTGTQAIDRALSLVRLVAQDNARGLRLVDLARALDVSAPTAHRMTASLVDAGLLRRDPDDQRFFLGDFVLSWGILSDPTLRLREVCRAHLEDMAKRTGDAAFLVVRSGPDAVCLDRAEGTFPIKALVLEVGSHRPLGVGAGGLAMLAALPEAERARVHALREDELRGYAGITPSALEAKVLESAKRGFALSAGIVVPGVTGVGVAIHLPGNALAALSLTAISARLDAGRIAEVVGLLRGKAATIERTFGSGSRRATA